MKIGRFAAPGAAITAAFLTVVLSSQCARGAGGDGKIDLKTVRKPCATVCKFGPTAGWLADTKRAIAESTALRIAVPVKTTRGIRTSEFDIPYSTDRAVFELEKRWSPGKTLVVQFLDNNDKTSLTSKVEAYARQWEQYVNLKFEFPDGLSVLFRDVVHVRISFKDKGCWSSLGTASLERPKEPSMNLELNESTAEDEVRRHVLHEFGHVLGLQHEHQNPKGGIQWKRADALSYFMKSNGWTEDQVQFNVFNTLSGANIQASDFDKHSIMLYYFPREITDNDYEINWNTELSDVDKSSAALAYPPTFNMDMGAYIKAVPGFIKEGVTVCALDKQSPLRHLRDAKGKPCAFKPGSIVKSVSKSAVNNVDEFTRAANVAETGFQIEYFEPERPGVVKAVGPRKGDPAEWPAP